ncbi:MAG: hypothetical protein ACLP9L_39110 [Thermoguttaceae bacterium]
MNPEPAALIAATTPSGSLWTGRTLTFLTAFQRLDIRDGDLGVLPARKSGKTTSGWLGAAKRTVSRDWMGKTTDAGTEERLSALEAEHRRNNKEQPQTGK